MDTPKHKAGVLSYYDHLRRGVGSWDLQSSGILRSAEW